MLVVLINLISRLINISGLRISNSKVFSSDYFYLLIESLPKWSAIWPFLAFTKYWRNYQNQTLFKSEKWCYLPHFWTDKVSRVTIGNRSLISLHGDSHEIKLTVPLNKLWKNTFNKIVVCLYCRISNIIWLWFYEFVFCISLYSGIKIYIYIYRNRRLSKLSELWRLSWFIKIDQVQGDELDIVFQKS